MTARLLAGIVGLFYVASGLWALVDPAGFAGSVATFSPFNRHLLHDTGAFSIGLGLALIIPAWISEGLRTASLAVLGASLLHLWAHISDRALGGRPATDIPFLALICLALAVAAATSKGTGTRAAKETVT
jgi:uncharacterized membrane protein